jgi:hypothetical protein
VLLALRPVLELPAPVVPGTQLLNCGEAQAKVEELSQLAGRAGRGAHAARAQLAPLEQRLLDYSCQQRACPDSAVLTDAHRKPVSLLVRSVRRSKAPALRWELTAVALKGPV